MRSMTWIDVFSVGLGESGFMLEIVQRNAPLYHIVKIGYKPKFKNTQFHRWLPDFRLSRRRRALSIAREPSGTVHMDCSLDKFISSLTAVLGTRHSSDNSSYLKLHTHRDISCELDCW
jgi:hypothetical protein